jgi:hypothetical protein
MPRLALALFAVAALAPAAPVPKAKKAAEPYPSTVGTKWEYVLQGDSKSLWTEEIVEADEKDGVLTVRVEVKEIRERPKRRNEYHIADGALVLHSQDGTKLDPPTTFFDTGWRAGDTLTQKLNYPGDKVYEYEYEVGKAEEITTPAGKFVATPVTRRLVKPRKDKSFTAWYAVGVGQVRLTLEGEETPVLELKSFTPGKK